MAKIIVTFNGLVQQEITISKSRLTIGRRPSNDIVIDHLTVSGQHAAIDTSSNGSFVLDLGSTNGTMVNGQPIKKHLLQDDDVIDIGKYKLRFQVEQSGKQTFVPEPGQVQAVAVDKPRVKIKVMNGNNAGKELNLVKAVTTIGSPGTQVIAITQQGKNYVIAQVEGDAAATVNTVSIKDKPHTLKHADMIELSGTKMAVIFY
ncbi:MULTISPECIES: FHA domain-containing protein [Undibacterium]|jgi:pSer/pThr/pTyr-binding forkhead associated (FHA) protein|uniref:FHA domain-containing protein n=1 Tax=Undibacterium umbellatum TaxID=2762300 RepID=A0ABR6ZH06_9BURK|nr:MULTISPECIES: FHA domain-containing protein [Undibacterium]MBC3910502.1 FHA domain-containing protein [Undibacterium umbellatum]MDP1979407.1 FHA domain-containing protein [Undibacterium sp.]